MTTHDTIEGFNTNNPLLDETHYDQSWKLDLCFKNPIKTPGLIYDVMKLMPKFPAL
jgi:hypothetical protein